MTAQDLHITFGLIWDEDQSDYVTTEEVDSFLNQAQLALFKQFLNPDGVGVAMNGLNAYFESNKKISQYLSPMIVPFSVSTDASGKLNRSAIETVVGSDVYDIHAVSVSIDDTNYYPAKWRAQSEINIQSAGLSLFAPGICFPVYASLNNSYYFKPTGELSVKGNAVKYPTKIDLASGTGSDFPEMLGNMIAFRAAQLAGVATRDNEFVQNIRAEINNIGV